MVIVFRKWKERSLFLLLFVILTCMLYNILLWVTDWIEPSHKYKEPSGKSVKVFSSQTIANQNTFTERLKFFYWYGE